MIRRLRRVDENARRLQRERGFKVHLVNPSMRAALFAPVAPADSLFGSVVESAVLTQWLNLPVARHLAYARSKNGEVDAVMLDPAAQRPRWALEIKWSDRTADRPEEVAALREFAGRHRGLRLAATTRTRVLRTTLPGGHEVCLVPAALLAFALGHLSASVEGGRAIAAGEVFDIVYRPGVTDRAGDPTIGSPGGPVATHRAALSRPES